MAVDEKLERDASIAATTMMYEAEELGEMDPNAKTIQLLSANPLCMTYDKLMPILEMINKYLPKMEYIYA